MAEQNSLETRHDFGGSYTSAGSLWVGNKFDTRGGNVYFNSEEYKTSFFATPGASYETWKNINPPRVVNTCAWFLHHPTFIKWKDSNHDDLLWLTADPGCGKSVLSRSFVDEKWGGTATLCYFFFKDNELQNNIPAALCAVLHQLFSSHDQLLPKYAATSIEKYGASLKDESEELWRIFISAAQDESIPEVICLFDALDECQPSQRDILIERVTQFYTSNKRMAKSSGKLKFLMMSRPYPEIEQRFRRNLIDVPTIRLAGEDESVEISSEIAKLIDIEVTMLATELRLSADVELSIHRRLSQTPNRTYLWLHLTMSELRNALAHTEKKLMNLIDTLPKTVEQAYGKLLERCPQPREATRLLQLIIAAYRPLTVREIDIALEIKPQSTSYKDLDLQGEENRKSWIRKLCGLFVTIVENRVMLIHDTAREFLIKIKGETVPRINTGPWMQSIAADEANSMLAKLCVSHLLFDDMQITDSFDLYNHNTFWVVRRSQYEEYTKTYGFLDYSAKHWIAHVQQNPCIDPGWQKQVVTLCNVGDGSSKMWLPGTQGIVKVRLRETRSGMKHLPPPFDPALFWAINFGLLDIVELLLKEGQGTVQLFRRVANVAAGEQVHARYSASWEAIVKLLSRTVKPLTHMLTAFTNTAVRSYDGEKLMASLLEACGDKIETSSKMVLQIATFFPQQFWLLRLDERGKEGEERYKMIDSTFAKGDSSMAYLFAKWLEEERFTLGKISIRESSTEPTPILTWHVRKGFAGRAKNLVTESTPTYESRGSGALTCYSARGRIELIIKDTDTFCPPRRQHARPKLTLDIASALRHTNQEHCP